jgi:GNAT superfamily N-acetyltransferase
MMIVRPIERRDRQQWEPLWAGYNTFYERTIPAAITDTTWDRFFDVYEPVNALVAEEGGKLIGLVHYIFHRNTTMIAPTCYLQDLFTSKEARGKGVGRALIEAVYAKAKVAGCPRVYWQTHETNKTAQILYDKVSKKSGFIVYRTDM